MDHSKGILVVGSLNMDMVVKTERFPTPGETLVGSEFGMYPGGKGANQAVCCARLRAPTHFLGKAGTDIFKDSLVKSMNKAGVRLEHLLIDNQTLTGIALITVDRSGENEIVVAPGSNMKLTPRDIRNHEEVFATVHVVLTQLEIPIESVKETARLAQEYQVVFILNPAPASPVDDALLQMVDYITPNETELEILTGQSIRHMKDIEFSAKLLLQRGVKNVIITLGEKGAMLVNSETVKLYPARKVTPVDTTAAGDAFNGALAYGLAKGFDVDRVIAIANIVASYSVTKMGAQNSMPDYSEIQKYIFEIHNVEK